MPRIKTLILDQIREGKLFYQNLYFLSTHMASEDLENCEQVMQTAIMVLFCHFLQSPFTCIAQERAS